MAASEEVRVLTLNCWGIPYLTKEWNYRISCIADELSKGKHDVVALQEIWTEGHYQEIKNKVAAVFPYSHYFYSGVIGTGLCLFSKYQIVDAFLHQFSANGEFYAVVYGDWFAGKGVGCCVVNHPKGKLHVFNLHFPINGDFYAIYYGDWLSGASLCCCYLEHPQTTIKLFAVHLHADYPSNPYTELRTLQAYECAQFVKKLTRPDDTVILCGDFNHDDTEIGIKVIKMLPELEDSWRTAAIKPAGPGHTISTTENPYVAKNECSKRIDFIFHSKNISCSEYGLDMEEIPGTKSHFSDHKGVAATLKLNDGENKKSEASPESNLVATRLNILKELQDTIAFGLKSAEEYKWNFIIPVWILLFTFIFMPVFSDDGVYFMLPVLSRLSGEIVFFVQISCVVISVSYFWILVILKKIEQRAYKNAVLEIQFKMDTYRRQGTLSSCR